MSRSRRLVVFVILALSAGSALADVVSAPRTIDVVVTDRAGHHLSGLTQADFQILEDGHARDIVRFSADAQPARNIILVIDSSSISLSARRTTIAGFRDFVNTRVRPIDKVMVASLIGLGAVMPGTWTSDKEMLLKELDKAEASSAGSKSFERRDAERTIEQNLKYDKDATEAAKAGLSAATTMITFDMLLQSGRQYAESTRRQAVAQAGAIADALAFLGNGPGKKIAVVAGGGLASRPGADIFEYLENVRQQVLAGNLGGEGVARGAPMANPLAELAHFELTNDIRKIALSARDRGITIYTIDPEISGSSEAVIERSSVSNSHSDFVSAADMLNGYQILTSTTGGLPISSRFGAASEIVNDLDAHYLLSYTQTLNDKGQLPRLEVKTTKPGARIRYGYTGGPATKDAEVKDAVIANQTAARLTNDLQIALAKDQPLVEGESKRVTLHVLIPMKGIKFVTTGSEAAGSFAVYIATGDDKGNSSVVDRQAKDLRFPADKLPQIQDKTIDFKVDVVLNHGRNLISIGVMDQQSQQTGFAKTTI